MPSFIKQNQKEPISRSALYLYLQRIVGAGAGYTFWIMISRLTGPDIVGLASTTMAIALIAINFGTLGIPKGLQRFLGKAIADNNAPEFRRYLDASIVIVGFGTVVVAGLLLILGPLFAALINLPYELLVVAIIIVVASGISTTLTGVFVTTRQVKTLVVVELLSSSLRILIGVTLIFVGMGALGVVIGNSVLSIVSLIVLGALLIRQRSSAMDIGKSSITRTLKELLKAGSARWVPAILYTVGMQLGVIVVFEISGPVEAGLYFIALAISSIIIGIYSSIMGVAFPILSGMKEGRKKAAWRTIRLSLAFCLPLITTMIIYSGVLLGVFGGEYVQAAVPLVILLLSTIPLIISTGIHTLAYAYGDYRKVLAIGLAGNIPSVVLYFILTPSMEGIGASSAYFIGSITGLSISIILARRMFMRIIWIDAAKAILIPLAVGVLIFASSLSWYIGGPIILLTSFFGYAKLNLITKTDLQDISDAIIPRRLAELAYKKCGWILDHIYKN